MIKYIETPPTKNKCYLIWGPSIGYSIAYYGNGWYEDSIRFGYDYTEELEGVTHWCELPEVK